MNLNVFSLLLCPYCEPEATLELIPLLSSDLEDGETRIHDGIIYCTKCKRFYIIKDEIVYLGPDNIREKEEEIVFLHKWKAELPEKIIYTSKPYNLTES